MKKIAFLILFIFNSYYSIGQTDSLRLDSLTQQYASELPIDLQPIFNSILNERKETNVLSRIDTSRFDYLLIEESYSSQDSLINMTERYFLTKENKLLEMKPNSGDPAEWNILPVQFYINGIRQNVNDKYFANAIVGLYHYQLIDYYYTLDTMLSHFSKLEFIQELSYDNTQAVFSRRMYDDFQANRKALETTVQDRLKTTYQIITLVNRIDKKVIVSFQKPPKNPKVTLRYLQRTNDW